MTDPYIILNELAQELRPMPQEIEWFEGLSTESSPTPCASCHISEFRPAPPPRTARKVSDAPDSAPRTHRQF